MTAKIRSLYKTILSLALCALLFSCSSSPSPSAAKKELEQRYLNSIKVLSFSETNAKEGELFGVKMYEMQYEAEIEFLDDMIVNPYEIRKGELMPFEYMIGGHQVKKGTREKIEGSVLFEWTKKGWMASGADSHTVSTQAPSRAQQSDKNPAKVSADESLARKFCGIWEYDESGSKTYLKITEQQPGRFKFDRGYKYEGKIAWTEPMLKDADGIYLQLQDGKLKGEFVSGNFYATHGEEFTYRVTLDLTANNKLLYSVWCSIRGETDKRVAIKIND